MKTVEVSSGKWLNWIAFQLQRDHGIERTPDDIWWAIYNDADRQTGLANSMAIELANNAEALKAFADSLKPVRAPVVIRHQADSMQLGYVAFCGFVIGCWLGWLAGALS